MRIYGFRTSYKWDAHPSKLNGSYKESTCQTPTYAKVKHWGYLGVISSLHNVWGCMGTLLYLDSIMLGSPPRIGFPKKI